MTDGKAGKISAATMAIILIGAFVAAATLLAIKIAGDIKTERKTMISEEIKMKKKPALQPEAELPRLEDIKGEVYSPTASIEEKEQEEKEPLEEVTLKDLPVDKALAEEKVQKKEASTEAEPQLNTQPSPQEMKQIKRKGLVIF